MGSERTSFLKPSTTSREVLYTCPDAHTGYLNLVILTNSDTTSRTILVEIYDTSETEYNTLFDKTVQTKDSTFFDSGGHIVLDAGDQIVLTATTADTITAIATVEEVFDKPRN